MAPTELSALRCTWLVRAQCIGCFVFWPIVFCPVDTQYVALSAAAGGLSPEPRQPHANSCRNARLNASSLARRRGAARVRASRAGAHTPALGAPCSQVQYVLDATGKRTPYNPMVGMMVAPPAMVAVQMNPLVQPVAAAPAPEAGEAKVAA
jgi:hypothetical protein